MKLSLSQLRAMGRKRGGLRFSRNDFIFWGVAVFLFLTVALITWDGLVFYRALFKERKEAVIASSFKEISAEEIKEVIQILDERERKFNDILAK